MANWKEYFGLNSKEVEFVDLIERNEIEKLTGKKVHTMRKTIDSKLDVEFFTEKWVKTVW